MGKEFQVARKKEEGQPMLLAITSTGECITTAYNGNERKKKSRHSKGSYRRKAKNTEAKSQSSSEVERANASTFEKKRRGRDNQDRQQNRGDEGEDKLIRRSAQELGIVHPGSYCDESEIIPHYWAEVEKVEKGSLFKCKLCYAYLWLPFGNEDTEKLYKLIGQYGRNEGYCIFLNRHRPAKIMIAKMQELSRLEKEIGDKREFARLADKILSEKEYDREEEMLEMEAMD